MHQHFITCLLLLCTACDPQGDGTLKATITVEQLLSDINKGVPLIYRDATIDGDLIFTEAGQAVPLTPNTMVVTISTPLYFERCQFNGKVSGFMDTGDTVRISRFMAAVTFQNCRFEAAVDFRGTTFEHHLTLNNSLFDQDVSLQAVRLSGDLRLEQTVFSSSLFLQEAIIHGTCWAKEATILGQFSAQQADFWQNAVFAGVTTHGYADFGLVHFRRSAFFEYGKFHHRINYSSTIFRHRAEWTKAQFDEAVDFQNAWFAFKPVFSDVTSHTNLDFTNTRFDGGAAELNTND